MTDGNSGFEVVDKRKKGEELEGSEEQRVEAEEEMTGGDEKEPEEVGYSPDVASLMTQMLSLLGASAWQWMGLIVNPVTKKVEVDLAQARLAIDCFEAVAGVLKPSLDEHTRKDLDQALADLRINFVERSRSHSSEGQ